jgi:uncharacterized membrane protein
MKKCSEQFYVKRKSAPSTFSCTVTGMEFSVLILLHVAMGIVWAGGAIVLGLFIVPSVLDAGPAGGVVMVGVVKRRLPILLTVAGGLVVLTGLRLYMQRFSGDWLTTPEGIVLTLGAILGLGGFVLGLFVQRPTVQRLGALAADIARAGGAPDATQAGELRALQGKLRRVARLTAWHLAGASLLMASHRLASML